MSNKLKGNKGEWSEVYTLLKVLGDKELRGGDEDLNIDPNLVYPVIAILREESNGTYQYTYNQNIVIINGENQVFKIPIIDFKNKANQLFSIIKNASSPSFSAPIIEKFLSKFNCTSIKTKSSSKSDIKITIYDKKNGTNNTLGFSIKSQLGGPSTLFNAGVTTNLIYEITGTKFNQNLINYINSIGPNRKVKNRVKEIHNNGGKLKFAKVDDIRFENNLRLVDSDLVKILANMIQHYYSSSTNRVKDLIKEVERNNPLGLNTSHGHPFYSHKFKRLLSDMALGMTASAMWDGIYDATGGYIVVKKDGDIVCYHIYNKNQFESYLFNNTKFDTASTTKHYFGDIFEEDARLYIKLNVMIKFIK